MLVSRTEELSSFQPNPSPLVVGKTLLYPNLGEAIVNTPGRELPFYFTVYRQPPGVSASVQLLRNGQVIAEAPVALADSAADRLQHVGRFPVGALPPGTYELRIRLASDAGEVSRSAFFTLESLIPNP